MKIMSSKRKRSNKSREDILSSLEASDRQAAKLRKSQISTETLPRSFAAKSQVEIQTNLMECRILIQQALSTLPNASIPVVSDDEDAQSGLDELFNKLVRARRQLCFADDSDSDNETESDSEDEDSHNNDKLAKEYETLRVGWKTTLNKHHANIHLQNQQNKNKFQVVDQSFWTQIESNVNHSAMLEHANMEADEDNAPSIGHDDSKLYQHMLKEYITLSAERGKDDAAKAAAERLKRSMKKKTKKDVDRRASKGRKIRYVVHEKLQNFTFPVRRSVGLGAMDEDVLFKSMLGGANR